MWSGADARSPRLDDRLRERDVAADVLVGSLLQEDLRQLADAHVEMRTVALGVVPGHHLARGEARGTHDGLAGRVQRTDDARALERGVRLRHPLVDRGLLLLEPAEQRVECRLLLFEMGLLAAQRRLRARQPVRACSSLRALSWSLFDAASPSCLRRAPSSALPEKMSAAPLTSPPAWYSATARSRR